jgi:hypothetical protein
LGGFRRFAGQERGRDMDKITNIALIFILMGVGVCNNSYALRVPMKGHEKLEQFLASGKTISLIKERLPNVGNIFFADIDAGMGEFEPLFRNLLEQGFSHIKSISVDADKGIVKIANEKGANVKYAYPSKESYAAAGLTDKSANIVTINNINPARLKDLIGRAADVVNDDGLILVGFDASDLMEGGAVDLAAITELSEKGFKIERIDMPFDYPCHSEYHQANFLLVARKYNAEGPQDHELSSLVKREQSDTFRQLLAELEPAIVAKMMHMPTFIAFLIGLKPAYYAYRVFEGKEVYQAVIKTPTFQKKFRVFPKDLGESFVLYDYKAAGDTISELNVLVRDRITTIEQVIEKIKKLTGNDIEKHKDGIIKNLDKILSKEFPWEPEAFFQEVFDCTSIEAESNGIASRDAFARGFIVGVPLIDAILFCLNEKDLFLFDVTEGELLNVSYLNKKMTDSDGKPISNTEYIIFSPEFVERLRAWDKALDFAYELMNNTLKINKSQKSLSQQL